ncbi:MAG TPA: NUDIX hydrolase [Actinomycetes bacterium]|jgi:ADP-ribose pyrophosphatase YjhB (NUDIX family)|nr:NUDIX hydrolase [Actinomycetes bacterium]
MAGTGPEGTPGWPGWAARLLAVAQAGAAFTEGPFDRERYLTVRAIALEIVAAHLELPGEAERRRLEELFAPDDGYPTPKVDVRALVRREEQVLLVRERADGRWSLPGGWADVGWSPAAMVAREVAEESGYLVRARRLLALWDRSRHNPEPFPYSVYKLAVACDLLGGAPAASTETSAVGWFPPAGLPPLSTTRITAAQIARLVELDDHPELPPDLD